MTQLCFCAHFSGTVLMLTLLGLKAGCKNIFSPLDQIYITNESNNSVFPVSTFPVVPIDYCCWRCCCCYCVDGCSTNFDCSHQHNTQYHPFNSTLSFRFTRIFVVVDIPASIASPLRNVQCPSDTCLTD